MSRQDMIKKALLLNNVNEKDILAISVYAVTFHLHLFTMLVLLLYNFTLENKISKKEVFNFVMTNFDVIIDIIVAEIEIVLLNFCNLYEEQITGEIEIHNKDECFIVIAVQEKVVKKLEKLVKKEV